MGCASSCRTFEMFSTAIEWVAKKHLSIPHLINILDDYLMAAPTYHQCRIDLARFSSLCDYLGVPMRQKKTVRPSNILMCTTAFFAFLRVRVGEITCCPRSTTVLQLNHIVSYLLAVSAT